MLENYQSAPISDAEKALLAYVEKVNCNCAAVEQADIDRLHHTGWTDEAIYDAITVCALFQFYNTWIDASGVSDMQPFAYERQAKRLAELGYAYAEAPTSPSSPRSG